SAHAANDPAGDLADVFETAYAIVTAAASGADCDPAGQALIVPRLANSVLRPLAGALSEASPARAADDRAAPTRAGTRETAGSLAQPDTAGDLGGAAPAAAAGTPAQPPPRTHPTPVSDPAQRATRVPSPVCR